MAHCPALLIAAPASGQGKTTVTAALARMHRRRGRRVRVFKCGPDFLDPQILAVASGEPVYNVDLGMCGAEDAAARFADAATKADLILVEGVMGLYDGDPSAADIATRFGIPVLAVIDAAAMAQTFGALVHGLADYRSGLLFAGVLANRVAGDFHARLLEGSLPSGIAWFGALTGEDSARLPERHLGLLQAGEIANLEQRLDRLADRVAATALVDLPMPVEFRAAPMPPLPGLLSGRTIAVARDAAFAFLYPANLDLLREVGARLHFFSPLAGDRLPDCDAVWLPGGYPELHADVLAARRDLWAALRAEVEAGKPLLAECGGMMALFDVLVDQDGRRHALAGLLPGATVMQRHLAAIGVQFADLPEGRLSGHAFHFSRCETPMAPLRRAITPQGGQGEAIYRRARMTASYVHFYFPSNPTAAAALFLP
jgi:cobyrinic acid a,c-diamide synthase